ncbi:hypothetical protein VE03_07573 [Pseudogymnoascus sp. 23342-1-I1]|nr:hypothetical protein VE03_07573 [Pseudogymnoascus sp. 23342-1-I1]
MCHTLIIFSAHCEHEHAEIQKCSYRIAFEAKWERKSFFSRLFSSPPRDCSSSEEIRSFTKAQVCPYCYSRGVTYEQIRRDRDAAQRRPPRPIYQSQVDLDISNPVYGPGLQMSNAMRQPTDQRPQGLQRSNTVQFDGEAPRLPHIRATAIFRESQNPRPDTLRQYLGSAGVPSENPETTADQRPPVSSSANRRYRSRGHSDRHSYRPPSPPYFEDDSETTYQRSPDSYQPYSTPPVPSRSSSQRRPRPPSEQPSGFSRPSSQQPRGISSNRQQAIGHSSRPPPSSQRQLALIGTMPNGLPEGPAYHHGMPTDRELNRMSREIETVESAWVNAGRPSSQQQPVTRESTGSLTAPRRHRSQRDGDAPAAVGAGK